MLLLTLFKTQLTLAAASSLIFMGGVRQVQMDVPPQPLLEIEAAEAVEIVPAQPKKAEPVQPKKKEAK